MLLVCCCSWEKSIDLLLVHCFWELYTDLLLVQCFWKTINWLVACSLLLLRKINWLVPCSIYFFESYKLSCYLLNFLENNKLLLVRCCSREKSTDMLLVQCFFENHKLICSMFFLRRRRQCLNWTFYNSSSRAYSAVACEHCKKMFLLS